jgi:ketosteroid isomerase-like protein
MNTPTNEEIVRKAYSTAEAQDLPGFTALFTSDGVVRDESAGVEYRGDEVAGIISNYAKASPDMHREQYNLYVGEDTVVVELSLNGKHSGPLSMRFGTIRPTGKAMHAPCCDVWKLRDGKIHTFNCYTAATLILAQLGVLNNLEAALDH